MILCVNHGKTPPLHSSEPLLDFSGDLNLQSPDILRVVFTSVSGPGTTLLKVISDIRPVFLDPLGIFAVLLLQFLWPCKAKHLLWSIIRNKKYLLFKWFEARLEEKVNRGEMACQASFFPPVTYWIHHFNSVIVTDWGVIDPDFIFTSLNNF